MNVTVLGMGYIGLPTASMLALGRHHVFGYDVSSGVRDSLRAGGQAIAETQVRTLFASALASKNLEIPDSLTPADAYIICVPTPNAADGRPDLTYVADAARALAPLVKRGDLVVLESTVPPGTTERVVAGTLRAEGVDLDSIAIAHCPERVIPGSIVDEMRRNARVIGGRRPADAVLAKTLYASFVEGEIHCTDCTTAELVKVVENTYRDVNIAFANELAVLCEELRVDAWEAIALANKHPRVNILKPGPGVGGHCIPIDPHFLADANPFVTELIQTARRVNARMPNHIVRRIREAVPVSDGPPKIALLGASYKADVDDSRESPTEKIDGLLRETGYETAIYDPVASGFIRPLAASFEEAATDADAIVLVTDHAAFKAIDPKRAGALVRRRTLIDSRNFLAAADWQAAGFSVLTLGRRTTETNSKERDNRSARTNSELSKAPN